MTEESDVYNIKNYNETQLYDILGLVNPSDRELEAKIMFFIKKYENNPEATQLYYFFEDVYNYFFGEIEDDEENSPDSAAIIEGFETAAAAAADATNYNTQLAASDAAAINSTANTGTLIQPLTQDDNINLMQQLGYSGDPMKLNPILKQTVTTMMTIDSSYREEKYLSSTSYSFNLSRPLRDVISLKLYSVQIPYTWWTINKNFGGNFFYFKGNVDGINNGNHDYKVEIPPGNYTGQTIVSTINSYLNNTSNSQCIRNLYTDVDFSGTYLGYNDANAVSNFYVKINKQYNETDYYLYFPPVESTIFYNSLYNFFGFKTNEYYFTTLKSNTKKSTNGSYNENIYTVDSSNCYFTIIHYLQDVSSSSNPYYSYNSSTSEILNTYTISIPTSTHYNESTIYTLLNEQIAQNKYLTDSYIERVTSSTSGTYYYEMSLKLNRYNTKNVANSKIVVVFPDESNNSYPIWTTVNNDSYTSCCFNFGALTTELSNLTGEKLPKETSYIVSEDLSFSLICTKEYYIDSRNNYYFDVSSSLNNVNGVYRGKYIISEYVKAINIGLSNTNNNTFTKYNPSGVLNMKNTYSYLDSSTMKINMKLDFNKTFTEDMYELDLSGSFFNNRLYMSSYISTLGTNITSSVISSSTYTVTTKNNKITLYPKSNVGLSTRTPFVVTFPTGIYTNLTSFFSMINTTFDDFEDEDGEKILNSTTVTYYTDVYDNNALVTTMRIRLKKTLTEKDYRIYFNTAKDKNYWVDDLKFKTYYDLKYYQENSGSVYYSLIAGITNVDVVYFVIDGSNDSFTIKAATEGVYSSNNTNDITFTISHGVYSQQQIIDKVNSLLYNNPLTQRSSIHKNTSGYMVLRIFVNKLYTALDYRIVFYDIYSFIKCVNIGANTINATWDTTLGWLLGFHSNKEYPLDETSGSSYVSNAYSYSSNVVSLECDTVLNTNQINYLLIVLDDYNQSHLNNSLVTVVGGENTIKTPSYANYYKCFNYLSLGIDPVTYNNLTQNQLYAIQQIEETNSQIYITNTYTTGPNTKDIFAMIPMKTTGMVSGQIYTEFGGSLQNQVREYFGPVNIQRITVTLLTNQGTQIDLNGADWSFTVIAEQLYNVNTTRPGKKASSIG